MCPSVRPSVRLSVQIKFNAAPNRRCRIAHTGPRLFSEQREYRSTIRKSLRRLAKGRRRCLDPERPTYLPCQTAGPCTHPRGAAPTSLSSSVKDYDVSVRPSVRLSRFNFMLHQIADAELSLK